MIKSNLQIALLIDGDNAQPTLIPSILEAVGKHGTCVIRRVYGDWTAQNMSGWRELERTHAIQLVQQSRYVGGKNATDIAITADAMEIFHSGKVDGFCIVSSDSDFTPLVIRLKDKGTTVIGVGKSTSPESYVNACSLFITTDTLKPAPKASTKVSAPADTPKKTPDAPPPLKPAPKTPTKASTPANPPKKTPDASPPLKAAPKAPTKASTPANNPKKAPNARPLLKKAYDKTPKTDEWVHLGALGHCLRQEYPQFKPKNYGQKLLSQLVLEYQDIFEIRKEKSEGNTYTMYIKLKT